MTIKSTETIHSDARHNAFTSMVRWRDRYYVGFRSADTHAATWEDGWGDAPATYGRIMLLGSPDLRTWTPSVILDSEYDDREAEAARDEERQRAALDKARAEADAATGAQLKRLTEQIASLEKRVFRNSCGRTSHEDRRVEIEAAENAEPGVAADGVPQQPRRSR